VQIFPLRRYSPGLHVESNYPRVAVTKSAVRARTGIGFSI